MAAHPRDPDTCWVIPLSVARGGPVHARRPHARVADARPRRDVDLAPTSGLPTRDAYMSVLREAMARDTLDPVGITFGTATASSGTARTRAKTWRMITDTLPEIWAVEAVVLEA